MLFISYSCYGGSYPHPLGCELAIVYLSITTTDLHKSYAGSYLSYWHNPQPRQAKDQ